MKNEVLSNIKQTEIAHNLVESILNSALDSYQTNTIQGLKSINTGIDENKQDLEISPSESADSSVIVEPVPTSEESKEEEKSPEVLENAESVAVEPTSEEPVAVASE